EPQTGNDLVLTLDDAVQQAGEGALSDRGLPGGFVAMNVQNGQLYGLGSYPTYDPSVFAKPRLPPATAARIFGTDATDPLPTPEERNQAYQENTAKNSPCGSEVCISEGEVTDKPWTVGDNIGLAVGQDDLQANPLQMATAYAAIANGGDMVRPHVGLRVTD